MAADPRSGFRLTPQALLGILAIVAGILLTADNLQWVDADNLLRFWPLGIVFVGAVKIAQSQSSSGRVFGGLILVVGMLWSAELIFRVNIDVEDWWLPMALIAVGTMVIMRAGRVPREKTRPVDPFVTPGSLGSSSADSATTGESSFSEVAIWAGKQRRCASSSFRHADLTAIMGGIELDLRGASTATGEAVIDLFVMWGGVEIWVPPDWAVSNEVGLLMAGAEDKSSGSQGARHRLIVRGFAVMGGVEIKT